MSLTFLILVTVTPRMSAVFLTWVPPHAHTVPPTFTILSPESTQYMYVQLDTSKSVARYNPSTIISIVCILQRLCPSPVSMKV